jgi:hypothetical protein
MHTAAIPRAEITSESKSTGGRDERISRRKCITGIFLLDLP